MNLCVARVALLAVLALAIVGCGPNLSGVTGTVKYKGEPLKSGAITFIPDKGRPSSGKIVNGEIVEVTTNQANDGLPPGHYKVHIQSVSNPDDMYAEHESLIPLRYGDPEKSGLTADIKSGPNELKFDLTD